MPHIKDARFIVAFHDLCATALALFLAFALRFEGIQFKVNITKFMPYMLFFVLIAGAVYAFFSLYSSKWRFASVQDLVNIAKATGVLALVLVILDYILIAQNFNGDLFFGKKTIIIYAALQILFLGGSRFLYRYYKAVFRNNNNSESGNLIVIGRSTDIDVIARALESNLLKGSIRGFLSPAQNDFGMKVKGIACLGTPQQINAILNDFSLKGLIINQAIIVPEALKGLDGGAEILGLLRRHGIATKSLKWQDSDGGQSFSKGKFENIHDEEILLRSLITIDADPLNQLIKGKKVVVTGGGGSIGSEITLRVAMLGASEVIILEHSEHALYHILEKLEHLDHASVVKGFVCDIRDKPRVEYLFNQLKPDLVFHAAALKHVPYLEEAPAEAIKTNAFGTMNVAEAARANGVSAFVLISTDKATRPTSVLGATKRLAELYVQMMDGEDKNEKMRFVSVRFGNVLATSGSVVPRFANQIAQGGPVTVTHKEMVRYFMTVREATDLVLTSSFHALNDDAKQTAIYILNMGQPVRIYDLAERMIRMAGFKPNIDMEIKVTGIRAGERLNEELTAPDEPLIDIGLSGVIATQKSNICKAYMKQLNQELEILAHNQDKQSVRAKLAQLVPNYKPTI